MKSWAKYYHTQGWPVFPVWYPESTCAGMRCACRDGARCTRSAKHPAVTGWAEKDLTGLDVDLAWEDLPDANIGVHCSALLVVDLDGKEGIENFKKLREEHDASAPVTPTAKTGGGGYHLYFKHVAGAKNQVALVPSVDVRAKGGYVIAPPSRSLKGDYSWVDGREPWNVPLTEAPSWLVNLVVPKPIPEAARAPRDPWVVPAEEVAPIGNGGRNNGLAKLCGRVIRARTGAGNLSLADVLPCVRDDMLKFNRQKCQPPLDDKEVMEIVNSIARYWKCA